MENTIMNKKEPQMPFQNNENKLYDINNNYNRHIPREEIWGAVMDLKEMKMNEN